MKTLTPSAYNISFGRLLSSCQRNFVGFAAPLAESLRLSGTALTLVFEGCACHLRHSPQSSISVQERQNFSPRVAAKPRKTTPGDRLSPLSSFLCFAVIMASLVSTP